MTENKAIENRLRGMSESNNQLRKNIKAIKQENARLRKIIEGLEEECSACEGKLYNNLVAKAEAKEVSK